MDWHRVLKDTLEPAAIALANGVGALLAIAVAFYLRSLAAKLLGEARAQVAMRYVRAAFQKFADNQSRREWAVASLRRHLRLPQAEAEAFIESAVAHFHTELATAGVDKKKTGSPVEAPSA